MTREHNSDIAEVRQAGRPRQVLALIMSVSFVLAGLVFGALAGSVYFSKCPVVYESQSEFLIESTLPKPDEALQAALGRPHAHLIASEKNVSECVRANNQYALESLQPFSIEDAPKYVVSNLEVEVDPDEPRAYSMRQRASDAYDAKTLNQNLMNHYRGKLNADRLKLTILKEADVGEPVWPILPICLAVGAGVGTALGMLAAVFVAAIVRILTKDDQ